MNRWTKAGAVVLCGLVVGTSHEAEAQFWDDDTRIHYDIMHTSTVIGHVVVTSHDQTGTYNGFAKGKEFWWWDTSVSVKWRGSFRLVPTSTTYQYSDKTWEVYDLDHFDLNTSEPMPDVTVTPDDRFYEVEEVDESTTPFTYTTVAYMHLDGGANGTQIWYGVDGILANDLVGDGADAIRLRAMDPPPAEDSIDINPLCDGTCP